MIEIKNNLKDKENRLWIQNHFVNLQRQTFKAGGNRNNSAQEK